MNEMDFSPECFKRLARSEFRRRFCLSMKDKREIACKGMETIRRHASDFVRRRLAPAVLPNDGRQTPMRGHPVFVAQHACACCCRRCLFKWHGVPMGIELTEKQQREIVDFLMLWIQRAYQMMPGPDKKCMHKDKNLLI